jgi:nitrogen regulatory protein P-II 1
MPKRPPKKPCGSLPISASSATTRLWCGNGLKRVEAFVRVSMLEVVKQALDDIGVQGMTCEQVRGYGRQFGRTDKYRGSTYAVNLLPKMKIVVYLRDEQLEEAIDAIVQATRTGEIGDGKVFISDVEDAIRVRTGERGDAALS